MLFFVIHYGCNADVYQFTNSYLDWNPKISFLNFLLGIILCLEIIVNFSFLKKMVLIQGFEHKLNIAFFFFISIGFSIWAYINSQQIVLWTDELNQFAWATVSPHVASGVQYQPPLSYYQSYAGDVLFSHRRFAIRAHTFANFALGLSVLFLFVKEFTMKYRFSFLMIFLCITNFSLLYHSVDARPQALSFLYLSFLLYDVYKNGRNPYFSWKMGLSVSSLTALFLLSMGLQPPFYLLAVGISIAFLSFRKISRRHFLLLSAAAIGGALLFAPYHFYTLSASTSKFKHSDLATAFKQTFQHFHWYDSGSLNLFNISIHFYILLISCVLFVHLSIMNRRQERKSQNWFLFFLVSTSYLFITILFNFYKSNIDYYFGFRYMFLVVPTILLLLTFTVYSLTAHFQADNPAYKKIFAIIFATVLFLPVQFSNLSDLKKTKGWSLFDGEKIYQELSETTPDRSLVYCLSAHWKHLYEYCSGQQHINQSYVEKRTHKQGKYNDLVTYRLHPRWGGDWGQDLKNIKGQQFSFVFLSDEKTLKRLDKYLNQSSSQIKHSAYFVTLKKNKDLGFEIYSFLKKIKAFLDQDKKLEYNRHFTDFLKRQKKFYFPY